MDLVDDIDFIFSLCWSKFGMLDDFSYIFDTSVARSIYLDHIDHPLICKSKTIFAFLTWISICEDIGAIHGLCKNSSECRFARSVKSEKYIAMVNCLVSAGIHQYFFDKALPHDIIKCMGSVFLIKGLMRYFWHGCSIGNWSDKTS